MLICSRKPPLEHGDDSDWTAGRAVCGVVCDYYRAPTEKALLGAAVRMKRAEVAEASQFLARARAQVRRLERLADAARRAVTEALSSAGDNAPSGPAVSSVGPAAVSSV
jgi:hypothetical protein